jgi:hypothetical protein
MFGWIDKIAAAIYRRGQSLQAVDDRVAEEKRTALRTVRDAIRDAMTGAEQDREHGVGKAQDAAMAGAQLAGATVREVHDDEARRLVAEWQRQMAAIPKGWKAGESDGFGNRVGAPGYPEPLWSELVAAADAAQDRLGALLRDLMRGG